MSLDSLADVLNEQLRDLMSAEKQLVKALPKMVKAASTDELRQAIEQHLQETEGHVERLVEIFELMDEKPKAKTCKAMQGLLEEGQEVIGEKRASAPAAIDAALIAAAQRVEHYEISAYGSARAFAEALGLQEVANLLQQTLEEESEANETLNRIAESVNPAAAAGPSTDGSESTGEDTNDAEDERELNSTRSRKRASGDMNGGTRNGGPRGARSGSANRSSGGNGGARAAERATSLRSGQAKSRASR